LAGGPFLYLDQYRAAQRLVTVPYETLHRLADGLPDRRPLPLPALPPRRQGRLPLGSHPAGTRRPTA
ncbi:hypothetical protein, partial [Micromonospora harpali]